MEFRVLKNLIYNGKVFYVGEVIDIIEKSVIENCLDRKLIEDIENVVLEVKEEKRETEKVKTRAKKQV